MLTETSERIRENARASSLISHCSWAQDRTGTVSERDLDAVVSVCVQHEMDHLDGKLFVDYLSDLKRDRIRKKLERERKERVAAQQRDGAARSAGAR